MILELEEERREKILLRQEGQVQAAADTEKEKNVKGLVTRMILELEEERRKDEKAEEEILAAVNCPSEGFHGEEAEAEPMEEERRKDEKAEEEILAAVNSPSEGFHGEEAEAE